MTLLLIYLLILLTVFLLQRRLLYFPTRLNPEQQEELLSDLKLRPWPSTKDFQGLISKTPTSDVKGSVLVFHGNAGSAMHRTYFIDALQKQGYRVIIAEYPGYGMREGAPSEKALIRAGIMAAKRVVGEFTEPLFLCGESLGCGVVAGIVASHEVSVKGLLLIAPFDSMTKVAHHHYWFFLANWLLLDRYDNTPKLCGFNGPVAILMAEQDEIIPNRNTLALFDNLSEPKRLWRFEHASHNTFPMEPWRPWWKDAMLFVDR